MNNTENNKKFYSDLWTNQWSDMEKYNPTAQHLKRIIKNTINDLNDINSFIDIGCGAGYNISDILKILPKT